LQQPNDSYDDNQKVLITVTLTAAVGAGLYEGRRAAQWHDQVQALRQKQDPLSEQARQLQQERDEANTRLAAVRRENEELRRGTAEMPRLRGEVARLRENARELAQFKAAAATTGNDPAIESAFKTWAARASRLRQRLEQAKEQRIPELLLLREKEWFDAVKSMNQLDTDEDFRRAFSNARNIAKGEFGQVLQKGAARLHRRQ